MSKRYSTYTFKPSHMTPNEYMRSVDDIKALEREVGIEPGTMHRLKWTDLKALYRAGKLHKSDIDVLFNKIKLYDPSLYDCVLNDECQIVHKSELFDVQMRERAKAIRNLF